jgi:hypothetical protein
LIKQLVKYINSFGSHSWGSELFEKQKDSVQSMRFPCVSWLLAVSKTGRYPNQNSFYLWFLTIKNMSGRNFSIDGFSTFFFLHVFLRSDPKHPGYLRSLQLKLGRKAPWEHGPFSRTSTAGVEDRFSLQGQFRAGSVQPWNLAVFSSKKTGKMMGFIMTYHDSSPQRW